MKKLQLIATGGTIACIPSDKGLVPALSAQQLLQQLGYGEETACLDLFSMDSSNVQPEEWRLIARQVLSAVGTYDGVVITHGTDTMAYTASMLSFMLQGLPIPVVLTGAQYPIIYPNSDGRDNLKNALIAAGELPGGVYLCFGNALIRGCRAVKTRTTSLNAFESINAPYVGAILNDRLLPFAELTAPQGLFTFSDEIDPQVALIKLAPGTSPRLLDSLATCDIHGVVVEAFGLGGVHNFRRDHTESLAGLIRQGIPVILTSQCLYEASTPSVYEVSNALRESGVISAQDMTTEASVTKLMWVLGHTRDMEEVRERMHTNLAGEIL